MQYNVEKVEEKGRKTEILIRIIQAIQVTGINKACHCMYQLLNPLMFNYKKKKQINE